MSDTFASGRFAVGFCDRCKQRYPLSYLSREVVAGKLQNALVCPECHDPDHPQLQLIHKVTDPEALRDPRGDDSLYVSGATPAGYAGLGSRDTQWGWQPVGGSAIYNLTPNNLVVHPRVGSATITTS